MHLSAEDEYPDLSEHCNHMAKVLTLDMYKHLYKRCTPSGFTIDQVIQTGVDNPGKKNTHSVRDQGQGLNCHGTVDKPLDVKHGLNVFLQCL